MPLELPSYTREELEQRARDIISYLIGTVNGEGADVSWGSDYDITGRLIAAIASMGQSQQQQLLSAHNPLTAFGAFLRQHGFERNVGPDAHNPGIGAAPARGKIMFRTSLAGATLLAGTVLRHADGTEYTVDTNAVATYAALDNITVGMRGGTSRRTFIAGRVGAVSAFASDSILQHAASQEFCAVRYGMYNATGCQQHRFELYNDLDTTPQVGDVFYPYMGAVADVTAVRTGKSGNKDPKSPLTVISPPANLVNPVHILEMSGGRDDMTLAEIKSVLRQLFLARGVIGTNQDVREIAMSLPTVPLRECYVMPGRAGVGTYTIMPLGQYGPAMATDKLSAVVEHTNARLPRGYCAVGQPAVEYTNAITYVDVNMAPGYGPDFATGMTLGQYSATMATAVPNAVVNIVGLPVGHQKLPRVGDRVFVSGQLTAWSTVATRVRAFLFHLRVTAITSLSSTSYQLTLSGPIPYESAVNMSVTPGGPQGDAIVTALLDAYDRRGASGAASGNFAIHPPLEANTAQAAVARAIVDVDGVTDAAVSNDSSTSLTGNEVWQLGATVIRLH